MIYGLNQRTLQIISDCFKFCFKSFGIFWDLLSLFFELISEIVMLSKSYYKFATPPLPSHS